MAPVNEQDQFGLYGTRIKNILRSELDDQELQINDDEIRRFLTKAVDIDVPLIDNGVFFIEIRGIARFWQQKSLRSSAERYLSKDILSGLCGQTAESGIVKLYYLIFGEQNQVRFFIGSDDKTILSNITTLLISQYPGIDLFPDPKIFRNAATDQLQKETAKNNQNTHTAELERIRSFIYHSKNVGIVTGIPTPDLSGIDTLGTQIDQLARGLYTRESDQEWAFLIIAEPEKDRTFINLQLDFLKEMTWVQQEMQLQGWREAAGQNVSKFYLQLLQYHSQVVEACIYEGGWWVQSYICSQDPKTFNRAQGLIKSVFSGDWSKIDRIRIISCGEKAGPIVASFSPIKIDRFPRFSYTDAPKNPSGYKYHTLLPSEQLSSFIHLPRMEIPRYYVKDVALFDVCSHVPSNLNEKTIEIGEIFDRGYPTGNRYIVPVKELPRHILLVGITGSGKTKTCFYILQQLQSFEEKERIQFLVIEPAKREYRGISKRLGPGKNMCVFTLGEEGEVKAPFRLNPFEIRYGVSVQTHIDLLKSVFNAAFGTFSPLPQVLERAIHEIYQDKGWDPVHSTNERAKMKDHNEWHPRSFPTLTDLFLKVSELVPKLGYDKEVERNVRTALETRINSLRVGAKGLMLDTQRSVPIEDLLKNPTVLELEGIGDDDEKAFIIGLLLTALYEYYRTLPPKKKKGGGGKEGGKDKETSEQHITVIEEAHRLLTNVPAAADPEVGNLKGKAVETFVNMLSEIRAYGEGFLIAEQIPVKLAPDVIKNTSLKIVHRTVSNDDRIAIGGAMNMNEQQIRQLVSLSTGQAVIHSGGEFSDDNPILVQVPLVTEGGADTSDAEVRKTWEDFVIRNNLESIFAPYPTCPGLCGNQNGNQGVFQPRPRCTNARRIAEDPSFERVFSRFMLSIIICVPNTDNSELPGLLSSLYSDVNEFLQTLLKGSSTDITETHCILTHAIYRFIDLQSTHFGWTYEESEESVQKFLPVLPALIDNKLKSSDLKAIQKFITDYRDKCKIDLGPFYQCKKICGNFCLYRHAIGRSITDKEIRENFAEALKETEYSKKIQELLKITRDYCDLTITTKDPQGDRRAALCFITQQANALEKWTLDDKHSMVDTMVKLLLGKHEER